MVLYKIISSSGVENVELENSNYNDLLKHIKNTTLGDIYEIYYLNEKLERNLISNDTDLLKAVEFFNPDRICLYITEHNVLTRFGKEYMTKKVFCLTDIIVILIFLPALINFFTTFYNILMIIGYIYAIIYISNKVLHFSVSVLLTKFAKQYGINI